MARKSIFKEPTNVIAVQIKIPEKLKDRIDTLKSEVKKIDENLLFDMSGICEKALELAVREGESEITTMKKESKHTTTVQSIPA